VRILRLNGLRIFSQLYSFNLVLYRLIEKYNAVKRRAHFTARKKCVDEFCALWIEVTP
jgi:hypothetical protein